jgi:hypothetical protein
VQIECKPSTNTQELKFSIQLVNKTTMPIAYSDITLRYWYKADLPNQTLVFTCDYARSVPTSAVSGKPGLSGGIQYIEVGFSASAGSLASGANSGEIQARMNAHDPGWNLSEADDYTAIGCPGPTTFMDWDHITGYVGGALVWGTEPTSAPARDGAAD